MKKALIVVSSLMLIAGVFSAQSLAHGGGKHGQGWHGWHGKKHAQVFQGKLAPVTGATGSTGQTGVTAEVAKSKAKPSRHHHRHGKKGKRAFESGPRGKAQWAQNFKYYRFDVKVKGLAASSSYNVAIYTDTDGQGCASTTNTALTAPVIPAITTDTRGNGRTKIAGLRSDASLDPAAAYYVTVTDASGAAVLCGNLTLKGKRGHKGGCHGHGGPTGETGATGPVDQRHRR